MPTATADGRFVYQLTRAQAELMRATEQFVLLSGAVRSGKTTVACLKERDHAIQYPGIEILLARWKDSDAHAILRPIFQRVCTEVNLPITWHSQEECYWLGNGSKVRIRGLKSGEDSARYSKTRGYTLARVALDQAEELPEDYYVELKARLSQPGFPKQLTLIVNPPDEDHWICRHWPEGEQFPDHRMIETSVYDNRVNLGEDYIRTLEAAYPPGHPKRRPLVEGKRGVSVIGQPVYGGYFSRERHVCATLDADPEVPICEGIDFGAHHPAAVWLQFLPWGALHVLGAVMGDDLFLEDFAPLLREYRRAWFPKHDAAMFLSACDPAGTTANSHGTQKTGIDVLREHGIFPRYEPGANHPARRDFAIQTVAGYMRRGTTRGPAFRITPRCVVVGARGATPRPVLMTGIEAGYVWDKRVLGGSLAGNVRRPLKDNLYEHTANALEYAVLAYAPPRPTETRVVAALARLSRQQERQALRALRASQRDSDSADRPPVWRPGCFGSRGGY